MRLIGTETPVRSYHYTLRNNPEERSSDLLRGGSLKSRMNQTCLTVFSTGWCWCNITCVLREKRSKPHDYAQKASTHQSLRVT